MSAPRDASFLWPALDADPADRHSDGVPSYRVSFYKPQGRPAQVSCSRVMASGTGFTYVINFKRKTGEYRQEIAGPATPKKIAAAFILIHAALVAGGHIAADTPAPVF